MCPRSASSASLKSEESGNLLEPKVAHCSAARQSGGRVLSAEKAERRLPSREITPTRASNERRRVKSGLSTVTERRTATQQRRERVQRGATSTRSGRTRARDRLDHATETGSTTGSVAQSERRRGRSAQRRGRQQHRETHTRERRHTSRGPDRETRTCRYVDRHMGRQHTVVSVAQRQPIAARKCSSASSGTGTAPRR